jgi:hypothetical protein
MLTPITEAEKAKYTLKIQFERAVEELLVETYESGYTGYLDIWPVVNTNKNQVVMKVACKKVLLAVSPSTNSEAMRYHIQQGKGCKRIK